jgi:hypothetical protein
MNMSSDSDASIKERAEANYSKYADQSANSDSEHESSDGYGQPNPSTFKIFIDSLQDAMPLNAHDTDHSDDEYSNDVHSASTRNNDSADDEEDDNEEEDCIKSDIDEGCYCPGCVSKRQMKSRLVTHDDDDEGDDCSSSDGDMPSLDKLGDDNHMARIMMKYPQFAQQMAREKMNDPY